MAEYACHLGLILVEQHPPRSEKAFYARAKTPLAIHFSRSSWEASTLPPWNCTVS